MNNKKISRRFIRSISNKRIFSKEYIRKYFTLRAGGKVDPPPQKLEFINRKISEVLEFKSIGLYDRKIHKELIQEKENLIGDPEVFFNFLLPSQQKKIMNIIVNGEAEKVVILPQ